MGKPAARLTDIHACPIHPPNAIIQGSPNVFTDSLPAARVTDKEACTAAIVAGSAGVFINGLPAARLSDPTSHGGKIATGSPDVFIGETKSPPVHPKPVIRKGKKNSPNASAAAPASAASETAEYTPGEEATKVISDKVEGLSDSLETAWSAMPMVGDDASRAQARDDIWQGTKDMAQGLSDLAGPSIIDVAESAYGAVTGDPEKASAISDQWDRTKEVWSNVADSAVDSWNEAEQRNGIPGAIEMSAVAIGAELIGGKGTGAASTAGRLGRKVPDAPDHDDLPAGTPDVESGMVRKEGEDLSRKSVQSIIGENQVEWVIDSNGSPLEVSGSLKEYYKGAKRSSAEAKAQKAAANKGVTNDHGGHVAAHRFVLDQGEKNLFPQNKQFNNSAFKTLENDYARFIDQGHEVQFRHELLDIGNDGRPSRVAVDYEVHDTDGNLVESYSNIFNNEHGQVYNRQAK